jgi:predicted Ser/Thr protein kinase
MKSIEEQIAIIGSAADGFRQEVIAYLWAANRRGEKIDYRSYEPLKEAIEKKLVTSVRDLSRVITKARMRDEEQSEKYNTMVKSCSNTATARAASMWCSSTRRIICGRIDSERRIGHRGRSMISSILSSL